SFDLTSLPGISLYGGFKSGGCSWEARSPEKSKTILSGRIDETRRIESVVLMGNDTLVSGFTITGSAEQGISGSGADFILEQCWIQDNWGYGVQASNSNISLIWCNVVDNKADSIRHGGTGYTLYLENCWVKKSGRFGVACVNSTPIIVNSVISESDMLEAGNEGILMLNPTYSPMLQNVTVSHNKAAGLSRFGGALPELQNCIVYHNGGQSLVGFSADDAAWYSCIQDCNSVNYNINIDPQFAYFDPNNVRIAYSSPCRDTGNPSLSYTEQLEMDRKDRVYGMAVDRGAYEVTCEDTSNVWDWNADGIVNFHDVFAGLAAVWHAYDPNDPAILDPNHPDHEYRTDPNSPGYVAPEAMALWYPEGYQYNFSLAGSSQYAVDVADLAVFVEQAPWLWTACWRIEGEPIQMMSGGSGGDMMFVQASETPAIQEKLPQEQMSDLVNIVGQLEDLWLTDPNIRQEIDSTDWQGFMDALYDNLLEVYLSTQ
ncbi:MAG TPA: right-handed parallel beta-helix repeat-containing protein, partial [Anaerohalosphaeraceae bacterium]|nr:right-handed parallel beta-helix repeat-containing protein [Anaerohalosphaeraceae bacterium]